MESFRDEDVVLNVVYRFPAQRLIDTECGVCELNT